MKKYFLLVSVLFASSILIFAVPTNDKKKKNENVSTKTYSLVTSNDSLSFAAGMAHTQGLKPYIKQQFGVDTTQMDEFVKGYRDAVLKGADPKILAYNAGIQIANMVVKQMLPRAVEQLKQTPDSINSKLFHEGFIAGVINDTAIYKPDFAAKKFYNKMKADEEIKLQANKKKNAEWLTKNASNPGVITTKSGLQYKILNKGTGIIPTKDDEVVVKYEGRDIDGNVFDSSYKRNPQTSSFPITSVIKGWTEALLLMPVGSKWELYVPENLAYGNRQAGRIEPYSTLIFDIELVDVKKKTENNSMESEKIDTTKTGKKLVKPTVKSKVLK
jgi:FKBP-type peptidyl-prolyl cis-trans isomerase FklB